MTMFVLETEEDQDMGDGAERLLTKALYHLSQNLKLSMTFRTNSLSVVPQGLQLRFYCNTLFFFL